VTREIILHQRSVASLAQPATAAGFPAVQHVHSLGPTHIRLPPLPTGGHFFRLWPVREWPEQGLWMAAQYESFAPPLFLLHDVLVHSSAGILAVGGAVIAETLADTDPAIHFYRRLAKGIAIRPSSVTQLGGPHVSLLAAAGDHGPHPLLDGLARLGAVPDNYLAAATGVLVPQGAPGQAEALDLYDLLPSLRVREVARDETLLVETLVFPLSVCGEGAFHPCVADFYGRLAAAAPSLRGRSPRRIYVDQRDSPTCRLTNEDRLIDALARLDFVPVRLDALSLVERINLFRQAEAVVTPQGAGLGDLGFAKPGCLLVELLMDACVDWRFRNLAALLDLRYDCVLGRAATPWPELGAGCQGAPWDISVNHVVAAVGHSLATRPMAVHAA
jgi:hypothetical protein